MTDNELIKLFLPILQAGLIANPTYSNAVVKQTNQPTAQGANSAPTLYFYKLGDPRRYGFLERNQTILPNGNILRTSTQRYETSFRMSALVRQNPENTNAYTASDLVNEASLILGDQDTIEQLAQVDVGILRVMSAENPYFLDDRDQHEASPFFDFTLTHARTRITSVSVIESINPGIYRV